MNLTCPIVVLAPGDQSRLSDAVPSLVEEVLRANGLTVVRFEVECVSDDGGVRDAAWAQALSEAVAALDPLQPVFLGGFSRGARVAAGLARALGATGVVAFAYPFHSRHDPNPYERVRDLAAVPVPVFLGQGTRDALGNREQILGYALPPHIEVCFLPDANHALHPRPSRGRSVEEVVEEAAMRAARFVLRVCAREDGHDRGGG